MGKSGGKKKKSGVNQNQNKVLADNNQTVSNGGVDSDSPIFLKRAHELKEEGNKKFQAKEYVSALEQYDNALKLIPKTHPDRAVFHSNRAACLMQMKPIDYETVIAECSMALQVQPQFVRALLRRARAYEAIGKYEMAMQDVQELLGADPNHGDGLDISRRLKTALGTRHEAQQDLQSRPSPAALGASAVRGAPVAGLGPCLPARPVPKKQAAPAVGSVVSSNKPDKSSSVQPAENGHKSSHDVKFQIPKLVPKPSNGSSKSNVIDNQKERTSFSSVSVPNNVHSSKVTIQWRPLKLIYGHDIRLAEMPISCSFKVLRELVGKRFPSAKSVLIKYKDHDGDLVTITCSGELRLAEVFVDSLMAKEPDTDKSDSFGLLRLHIVEVSPEQEPLILEEEEEEEKQLENEGIKGEEESGSSLSDSVVETVETETDGKTEKATLEEKPSAPQDPEGKEVEMDDWLFEFAQLFRTHVGIDPDAHIDLHELGMELCSEALEETVTSEEAQSLFDKAAIKFQEVAALAYFNWGNVHMCAARKKIPIDDSAAKDLVAAQLQTAYDWVKEKYSLARQKYEEALSIKPDFYEGLLALGQQQFEMAKLHWSYVLAKKEDLSNWDPTETIDLFDSAQQKMQAATEMWEKLEEQRAKDLKDPSSSKVEELLKRKKKQVGGNEGESSQREITPDEAAEQAAVMRSQIHLFWGNMLFERSQVECKLGMAGWDKNLETAVERFKLAGASEADISTVLKNHCSKADAVEGSEKKENEISSAKAGDDNHVTEISVL
ncbi:HSP-interacting protein [Heracleum sosnowskyi]|uniref:HSP-interacting protein n=1 Tax=Heracleum sosnowskyi TaxID=360622 RepID=A0AAD8I4N1_9APIA|nr:HSP-interacting protein [Heracleum sosnowskyi]